MYECIKNRNMSFFICSKITDNRKITSQKNIQNIKEVFSKPHDRYRSDIYKVKTSKNHLVWKRGLEFLCVIETNQSNIASGGHTGSWPPAVAESVTRQHRQTRTKQPLATEQINACQPAIYISFACLFYLFNKQNKLNFLVSLIFLATNMLVYNIICN